MIGALDCDGTVSETDARSLTGDLIALAGLIKMSWPAGDQFVWPCLREHVAAHVERTRDAVTRLGGSSADRTLSLIRRPPGDPATCAALMLAADDILALDWRERREATAPMIGHLRLNAPRALHMMQRHEYCSPSLRATLAFRRASFRRTQGRPEPRSTALHDERAAQHGPQKLNRDVRDSNVAT